MTRLGWLLAVVLSAGLAGCKAKEEAEADAKPEQSEAFVTVKTELARRSTVAEVIDGLGKVEALPDQLAILTPAVEGHVHTILTRLGDEVKKGQPIVELDRAVAEADLAEKTATRDGLQAALALLKSVPRLEERRSHEIAIQQARVAVERAKAQVDGLESLRGDNLSSKQQLFDARKALETAKFAQESAEATLQAMLIGPRPEAVAEAEAKIKTAQGLVEFSKAHLDFHTIRSPIDGVLDSLTCHPGQTIAIGTTIGEVVNTRRVNAAVWLSPRLARGVEVGKTATVRPSDEQSIAAGGTELAGKVDFVGRVADPQTGNLPVRILVENVRGQLALGQSIQATIERGAKSAVLQVPVAAVLDLGEGLVLGVIRDGKSVLLHPQVGTPRDGWVGVSGTDLKEGEPVIVEGGYSLPEGTPVKIAADEKPRNAAGSEVSR